MIYQFVILSGEDENFLREILVDSEINFLQFNDIIMEVVGYDKSQLSTFYTSNEEWEKCLEISIFPSDINNTEVLLMEEVILSDILVEKRDRLIFQFDLLDNRGFFIELINVSQNASLSHYKLVRSEGNAPEQASMVNLHMEDVDAIYNENASKGKSTLDYFDEDEFEDFDDLDDYDGEDNLREIDGSIEEDFF